MSRFINLVVFALLATTVYTFSPLTLAQRAQQSPLAATFDELKNQRLARPLSRNEEAALRPMDEFNECELCPEMVVVPAGQFLMGAKEGEPGSTPDERPQHGVNFAQPFSAGRFPVTFSEWDACVAAKGCNYQPSDQGWGRGSQPVINILWDDAQEYVTWLSRATGRTYRLLSEAEREYVARAGTTTAIGGVTPLIPRRQTARSAIAKDRLLAVAAYRSLSRRSKPCRSGHSPQTPGGSIRFTATSMTGSKTAGMTTTMARHLTVQRG
jgi:formylglycine-generating enzyme required for sulfatase activity